MERKIFQQILQTILHAFASIYTAFGHSFKLNSCARFIKNAHKLYHTEKRLEKNLQPFDSL